MPCEGKLNLTCAAFAVLVQRPMSAIQPWDLKTTVSFMQPQICYLVVIVVTSRVLHKILSHRDEVDRHPIEADRFLAGPPEVEQPVLGEAR